MQLSAIHYILLLDLDYVVLIQNTITRARATEMNHGGKARLRIQFSEISGKKCQSVDVLHQGATDAVSINREGNIADHMHSDAPAYSEPEPLRTPRCQLPASAYPSFWLPQTSLVKSFVGSRGWYFNVTTLGYTSFPRLPYDLCPRLSSPYPLSIYKATNFGQTP